ncbi:O-acyltransferase WSD1 [Bienertia sinuspersici]
MLSFYNLAVQQSHQFTAILVVNLRCNSCLHLQDMSELMRGSSNCGLRLPSWGNKTGLVLLPIFCNNGLQPLDHVRAMKTTMDKKKHSYEAHLSHWALKIITSYLGPKIASWCCHRVLCNTTLLISNIMGPSEEIVIADNPVISMGLTISGQPHVQTNEQAITMHMVSYAGQANLQVMVAKDIIHDPEA